MRLQKYIAAAGVCSRREAENRIRDGRVTVNGRVAVLGESVESEQDTVKVDGERVCAVREHTYIVLHKPRGYVTTMSDEKGRPTVAELIRDVGVRVYPVGRLDCMSEGLLLMTDDGETANRLAHPSHGVRKTYRVNVSGDRIEERAERMRHAMTWEGIHYRAAEVHILKNDETNAVLDITVGDGKNHEVRNMCACAGLTVRRLVRIRQGELSLGRLPSGKWRYLTEKEIEFLHSLE